MCRVVLWEVTGSPASRQCGCWGMNHRQPMVGWGQPLPMNWWGLAVPSTGVPQVHWDDQPHQMLFQGRTRATFTWGRRELLPVPWRKKACFLSSLGAVAFQAALDCWKAFVVSVPPHLTLGHLLITSTTQDISPCDLACKRNTVRLPWHRQTEEAFEFRVNFASLEVRAQLRNLGGWTLEIGTVPCWQHETSTDPTVQEELLHFPMAPMWCGAWLSWESRSSISQLGALRPSCLTSKTGRRRATFAGCKKNSMRSCMQGPQTSLGLTE